MSPNILELHNLHYQIDQQTIIKDISFTQQKGEIICFFGPSGCGKTTLLKLIAQLLNGYGGQINNHAQKLAYLFQEPRLLPWKTALNNVKLILDKNTYSADGINKIRTLFRFVGLSDTDLNKYPSQLSGGMRQRVALVRALINQPDLLLMDEPFSALNFELRLKLQDKILDDVQNKNLSVILVTHDSFEAVRMADKIYFLTATPATISAQLCLEGKTYERSIEYIQKMIAKIRALST
ncbi:MAG: ABC transporter ATP-binding protein [Alphaproteobacteria bacterium]